MKRADGTKSGLERTSGARPVDPTTATPPRQGVRVPIWFTVAQARKVAALKRLDCVLVEERGRICGLLGREVLGTAPAGDLLARWVSRAPAA
jgi:hypothetical protein